MNRINLYLTVISILFFSLKLNLFSGELFIKPEQPQRNQLCSLIYTNNFLENSNSLIAIVYQFKNNLIEPEAIEVNLQKESQNTFSGIFFLNDDVAFCLIKIMLDDEFDSNNQQFWDFTVVNENLKPVLNADYFKAYSYLGTLPENCQRLTNFKKAVEYFENELKNYTENRLALLTLLLIKKDRNLITDDDFRTSVNKILDKFGSELNESELVLMLRALRLINENRKAESLEKNFIKKNPTSRTAQEYEVKSLSSVTRANEFHRLAFEFLIKYPDSHLREKIWVGLMQSFIQTNQLERFIEELDKHTNVPHQIYSRLAFNLIKNKDISQSNAKNLDIDRFMNLCIEKFEVQTQTAKPKYYSDREWQKIVKINLSRLYQEWGDLYSLSNDFESSYEKYLEAMFFLNSDYPISLTESFLLVATQIKRDSMAIEVATRSILDSKSTNFIDSVFLDLNQKKYKSDSIAKRQFNNLKKIAEKERRKRLKSSLLNLKFDSIQLQTLDNTKLNLNNYKNNILILALWAKWCNPCINSLKFFEDYIKKELYEKNVIFFSVNTMDEDKKKINEFLRNNKINLTYYVDINDEIALNLGLSGLPTTVFIDKSGIIRYIEKGFIDKASFKQIIEDMIFILE